MNYHHPSDEIRSINTTFSQPPPVHYPGLVDSRLAERLQITTDERMYYAEALLTCHEEQQRPADENEWLTMLLEGKRHMMPGDICKWKSYSLNGQLAAHTASLLLQQDSESISCTVDDSETSASKSSTATSPDPIPSQPAKLKYRKRGETRICNNCNTTTSPLWRRSSSPSRSTLCNACGLYILQHHTHRPLSLLEDSDQAGARGREGGTSCSNCHTTTTSAWRRSGKTGEQLCNACGVYLRTRGEDRPAEWRKNKVKHRTARPT